MKTKLLIYSPRKWNTIDLTKRKLNYILIAFFSILYTSGFAQKVVDHQELEQKLTVVNDKIQKIDDATATINARIAGIPPENLDPAVQVRLNDLQIQRDQHIRERMSIEAALNSAQNSSDPNQMDDNSNSAINAPKTQIGSK